MSPTSKHICSSSLPTSSFQRLPSELRPIDEGGNGQVRALLRRLGLGDERDLVARRCLELVGQEGHLVVERLDVRPHVRELLAGRGEVRRARSLARWPFGSCLMFRRRCSVFMNTFTTKRKARRNSAGQISGRRLSARF